MARTATGLCAILLVAAGCNVGAEPSPTIVPSATTGPIATALPSPSPTSRWLTVPALDTPFVSTMHGYSLRHPSDWYVYPAEKPWRWQDGMLAHLSPVNDRLGDGTVRINSASVVVPADMTAADWLAWYAEFFEAMELGCEPVEPGPPTIAAADGTLLLVNLGGCDLGWTSSSTSASRGVSWDLYAVVGGRGYSFYLDGPIDRAYVSAIMATLEFQPEAATGE